MDNSGTSSLINELLIQMHRSLLQYSAESWPWASSADGSVQQQVMELAGQQEQAVKKMVDVLASRQYRIDFGVYPHAYTSLHFVSLEYFLGRLKESENALLSDLNAVSSQFTGDPEGAELAQSVIATQQQVVEGLKNLNLQPAVV